MKNKKKIYAVIDTNVLVSSLFSKDGKSNPALVISAVFRGAITPLFNETIIEEYRDVLSRDKFKFNPILIDNLLSSFIAHGICTNPADTGKEDFPDPDDIVFYEVTLSVEGTYLITGNIKHFPSKSFVITPAQMVEILRNNELL